MRRSALTSQPWYVQLDNSQLTRCAPLVHCRLNQEGIAMKNYSDSLSAAVSFNEYLVKAAMEYWTAMSFPALYYAKYL